IPFAMAHTPLKMTIPEAHAEVKYGWEKSYSPEAISKALEAVAHKPLGFRVNILISRICFRGIYFPQLGRFAWVKTIFQNRHAIFGAVREGLGLRRAARAEASLRLSSSAQR
ncbi:MAG: hypothetical protein ABLT11_12200, partial [Candidatus Acidiferrum sp.]